MKIEKLAAKNGQETLKAVLADGRSIYLHSSYDPGHEADCWAEEIEYAEGKVVVLFGLGLGYHLEALVSKLGRDLDYFVVEPCSQIREFAEEIPEISALIKLPNISISSDWSSFRAAFTQSQKSWQEIILASVDTTTGYSTVHTVDGWSLPDTIGNIFASGQHHDVPYMVGMGGGEIRSTTPLMGQLLQTMSTLQTSPVYTYVFTHVPRNWADGGVFAFHGLEVSYQYGVIDTVQRLYGTALLPASPEIDPDPGLDERDYWLTDAVMTMWTRFAATGSPTGFGKKYRRRVKREFWPPYDAADQFMDIGVPLEVKTGFSTLTEFLPPR